MSKVEVNQVTQQCGTTLTVGGGACKTAVVDATTVTLGRCGGTVSLASGATQSGFGRTGTVDWITTPKVTGDSPVTGVTGKGYFLNTTAGTITLNLPAGSAGDIISLADYAATWQTNNVTLSPNGSEKIGGINADITLNTEGQSITLVYVDSTQGWLNTMDSTSNVRGLLFMAATVSGACNAITTCGDYKIATFKGPGTFCVSQVSGTPANNSADYLVVAGGGGAQCGGGGAGGVRMSGGTATGCYSVSPLGSSPSPVTGLTASVQGYPITVGAGGAGHGPSPPPSSTPGGLSTFDSITSAGGGAVNATSGSTTGGSGGGSYGSSFPCGSAGNTPPTTPPQGSAGGNKTAPGSVSAGGGGAEGTGGNAPSPRIGGAGSYSSINPSPGVGTPGPTPSRYYGGGGGGGASSPCGYVSVAGGVGGGGVGLANASIDPRPGPQCGTVNTGGGGGGAWNGESGAGGSGMVIIRYKFQ